MLKGGPLGICGISLLWVKTDPCGTKCHVVTGFVMGISVSLKLESFKRIA